MKTFWTIFILQCLLVLVLYLGDIGFDKPGKYGLSFDHLLVLMFFLIALFVAAIVIICRNKQWKYLSAEFFLLIAAAAVVATS